jgi:hypothetical protein
MRVLTLILVLSLAAPIAQADSNDIDPMYMHAFLLDDHPFTITPCGGDPMPVIDIILEDSGNNPIEVIASDIWLDSPGELDFCWAVIADSSTFSPDPGHTTISGILRGGLGSLADCNAVRVDVIAIGWVIGGFDLHVNSPDLTGNQQVTVADFGLFAERFQTSDACADYDESGFVSVSDFGLFAGWFESCVCAP